MIMCMGLKITRRNKNLDPQFIQKCNNCRRLPRGKGKLDNEQYAEWMEPKDIPCLCQKPIEAKYILPIWSDKPDESSSKGRGQ